jgi:hypothetical protein
MRRGISGLSPFSYPTFPDFRRRHNSLPTSAIFYTTEGRQYSSRKPACSFYSQPRPCSPISRCAMADAGSSQGEEKSKETATVPLASNILETFPIEQHTLPWSIVSIPNLQDLQFSFRETHSSRDRRAGCTLQLQLQSRPYCWQSPSQLQRDFNIYLGT